MFKRGIPIKKTLLHKEKQKETDSDLTIQCANSEVIFRHFQQHRKGQLVYKLNTNVATQFTVVKISRSKLLLASQSRLFKYKPLQQFNIKIVERNIYTY